jgi:hypothetical protein
MSSPEHGPTPPNNKSGEQFTGPRTPEAAPRPPEQGERQETHERSSQGPADPAVAAPALPALPALPVVQDGPANPATTSANPTTAADEDLIEKEWVERAKKVIDQTKHDPYLQNQEVSRLQADYLQKRYGKTVKLPQDGA